MVLEDVTEYQTAPSGERVKSKLQKTLLNGNNICIVSFWSHYYATRWSWRVLTTVGSSSLAATARRIRRAHQKLITSLLINIAKSIRGGVLAIPSPSCKSDEASLEEDH